MSQINMNFDARTMARSSDPSTSKEAAARVREFASGQCVAIHLALSTHGDLGAEQIGDLTDMDAYTVRKRLADLKRHNRAEPTGDTRLTRSGRSERKWRAL